MTKVVFMVSLVVTLFALSAVYGLAWAVRRGQMRDFRGAARSIFDDEEPQGAVTDAFPEEPSK